VPEPEPDKPPPDDGDLSLAVLAGRIYADVAAKRFDSALRMLDKAREERCYGSVRVRGNLVVGPRAVVTLSATGSIVGHQVFDGCVRHAGPDLVVTESEHGFRILHKGASIELPREEGLPGLGGSVYVSDAWALVIDPRGDYLALRIKDSTVLRGHSMPDAASGVAGDTLVLDDGKAISLVHTNGKRVVMRGCPGRLLAAAASGPRNVALHIAPPQRAGAEGSSAETRLCLVREDGSTSHSASLGTATCGLARAMPCPWELQIATPKLLGFGSMRGGLQAVDAVTGRILTVPLPQGAYPDGLSPGGFFRCEGEVCISYNKGQGETGASQLILQNQALTAKVLPAVPEEREWCVVAGLPVPRELCGAENQEAVRGSGPL
jgi:hypothetical protein